MNLDTRQQIASRAARSIRLFDCRTCGARAGQKCKTVWGNETQPHMNRYHSLARLEGKEQGA